MTSHIATLDVSPFGLTLALPGYLQALALRPGMAHVSSISSRVLS
jgi:hypothetical protein